MRGPSLTLAEARDICSSHQYLIGRTLTTEPTDFSIIECVAIAPYDEVNQWIFAHYYMEGLHPQDAAEFLHYPFYDVIVLARYKSDNSILYTDLNSYLRQKASLDMTIEA